MNPLRLLIVAGARPNFMKVAPLIRCIHDRALRATLSDRPICYTLVHTGQHYDDKMSGIFFEELGIPAPNINLEVGSGSHALQTANIMTRFEPVCLSEKPDWLVVVGDINSTMACTLVASKLGVKVAHVEAGLRSGDRSMPEEVNRLVTDALADLLLTPSADADENLKREGVPDHKIKMVGNIMIDSLVANQEKASQRKTHERFGLKAKGFAYVTLHRPSNVDDRERLSTVMTELKGLSRCLPVIFPIHPRTRKMLKEFEICLDDVLDGLRLTDPVGYLDSLCLTQNARLIVTDSGGLQEEATYFRTPCLTLRDNTERPITIAEGSNRLTQLPDLSRALRTVLQQDTYLGRVPRFWDGNTADRVITALLTA